MMIKKTNDFFTSITMCLHLERLYIRLQKINRKFKGDAILIFLFLFFLVGNLNAQQNVYWRNEAANGNWENGSCAEIGNVNSQWWYSGFGSNSARNRPDCSDGSTTKHNLEIGNNHQTTMVLNTAFWGIRQLVLTDQATDPRFFNASPDDGTRGIGITHGVFNNSNSGVTHTFNVRVAADASTVTLSTNNLGATTAYHREIFTNGNTIQIDGAGSTNISGVISGIGNLTKNGNGILTVSGASTYTGTTRINAGILRLSGSDRLSNSSNMILGGGTFSSGISTGNSETVGSLQLLENSTIALGTEVHNISFSASNGVSWTSGKSLTITGWQGTEGMSGTAGKIFFGNSDTSLSAAQLHQISFVGYGVGAMLLATGELVPLPVGSQISFANIQLPKNDVVIPKGSSIAIFAHVIAPGTSGAGQSTSPAITAWIGYTTNATDAANGNFTSASWNWVPASYNIGYDGSPTYQDSKDEYMVYDFGQTTGYQFSENAGDYYYVSRFQIAGETDYVYGGSDGTTVNESGGIWNGSNFVARKITVQECAANTWNGTTWSQGTPTVYHRAVIAGNYSGNSFEACECEVNSNTTLTIGAGKYVKLRYGLTVNTGGNVIVENDGNLVQVASFAVNTGAITVKRNASMKRLDYTYWGSPVSGQNVRSFSPGTLESRFYVYNERNDYFDGLFIRNKYPDGSFSLTAPENPSSYTFIQGKGYGIRASNYAPATLQTRTYSFVGVPNNGTVSVPLVYTDSTRGFNLVSNPYPSNLDLDELYADNPDDITGTFYFWTNINPNPAMQGANYPSLGYYSNYAVYNLSGGTPAAEPACLSGPPCTVFSAIPTNIVKPGQGFLVRAREASKVLDFRNSQRDKDQEGVFFNARQAKETRDRFWLQLQTPLNLVNTQLIAYKKGSTKKYEENYDAKIESHYADLFYSFLNSDRSDEDNYLIQGRGLFSEKDKINLGASFYQSGIHVISIAKKEGVFEKNQAIYLKDKLLNKMVNLNEGEYSFYAEAGVDNQRFEIVYKPESTLSAEAFTKTGLQVYPTEGWMVIESPESLSRVWVSDATGKQLYESEVNGKTTRIQASHYPSGMYYITVETADGDKQSQKVLKK